MRVFSLNQARDAKGASDAKFLRATKRFFKKIYTTATFPNKKVSLDAESHFQKAPPLFDNGSRGSVLKNDTDFSRIEDFQNYSQTYIDTSYPDSGLDLDRSSTPDQSMGSMTVTSSDSRVTSSESSREDRCEDLFETLRREMPDSNIKASRGLEVVVDYGIYLSVLVQCILNKHAMRARDAAILADLHRVESQIQSVKLARLGVYSVATQQQPVQSLPI
uniref:BHLH domain-containing protein n=1 Tax=Angiostrongylus cantonensis TaxID=6313 RepID=A0A0K0D441_ANGCA